MKKSSFQKCVLVSRNPFCKRKRETWNKKVVTVLLQLNHYTVLSKLQHNVEVIYRVLFLSPNFTNFLFSHLLATFSLSGGFYDIPLTLTELLEADSNYVFMTYDFDLNVDFFSYPNDPRVSIGYDSYGNVAAIRMGVRTVWNLSWTNYKQCYNLSYSV